MELDAARADIDGPDTWQHVPIDRLVSRCSFHNGVVVGADSRIPIVDDDSSEILLLLDPSMQRIHLEVLSFDFEPVVEVVVEAVSFCVKEREHTWTAHEIEQMLKQIGICIEEVRSVGLGFPREAIGQLVAEEP